METVFIVDNARRLFRQHRFKVVDMTGKPVEEAAREVLMLVSPSRDQK